MSRNEHLEPASPCCVRRSPARPAAGLPAERLARQQSLAGSRDIREERGDGPPEPSPAKPTTNSLQVTAARATTTPSGLDVATTPHNGGTLLIAASCLLLLVAAAQGYVSVRAQYAFVDHAKHARVPFTLEALGLDTGAVIFALLALSLARRQARRRRTNAERGLRPGLPDDEPARRGPDLTTIRHGLGPAQRTVRPRLRPAHRRPALGSCQRADWPVRTRRLGLARGSAAWRYGCCGCSSTRRARSRGSAAGYWWPCQSHRACAPQPHRPGPPCECPQATATPKDQALTGIACPWAPRTGINPGDSTSSQHTT